MTWNIEFLEEAKKDLKKLDHSVQLQVVKGIEKVRKNPLPTDKGGYGKPLGNKNGINLTNLLKIKFRDLGIRVVYKSLRKESKVVQTKKQYGDFSLTALSFASISIFSG